MTTSTTYCVSVVPTFFRALCHTARSGRFGGYANAGRELTRHLGRLVPDELTDQDWSREIHHLSELCDHRENDSVLSWFTQRYPRCMALVPVNRRGTFLKGVYEMMDERWA